MLFKCYFHYFYSQTTSLTAKGCPSFCECKWKKGKETVECVNANLTSVPLGLNADTQVNVSIYIYTYIYIYI